MGAPTSTAPFRTQLPQRVTEKVANANVLLRLGRQPAVQTNAQLVV